MRLCLCVAILAGLVPCRALSFQGGNRDDDSNPLTEAFDAKVEHVLEHYHVPGLAVSVVRGGKTYAKGYGTSNLSTTPPFPVTPDTLFFAGSTTKAHTAAAISLLVANNTHYPHIQWSTPLHDILPEFILADPYATTHLTLVDILSHRSGLPRHDQVLLQDISIEDVVHRLKYLPLTEEVRTSWQYCNLMYVVAAHLIEKTSNQSLYEFFRENLWEPLGMHSTYLDVAPARRDNRDVSEGYWFNPETNETLSTNLAYGPVVRGAGNTLTSVNDYAKWISALLSRSAPISENAYEMLFGAHSVLAPEVHEPFSAPDLYGFGWALQSYKGVQIIQHGGAQVGFGAFVVLIPKMQAGFVILGNEMVGANRASLVLAFEIIDNLLGIEREERFNWEGVIDTQAEALKLSNKTLAALYPDLPDTDSLLPHPLPLDSYSGRYTHPAYPALLINSSCPDRSYQLKNPEKWTGARLCADFDNYKSGTFATEIGIDLFHVTGTYWTLVSSTAGMDGAARVEFRIAPDGTVIEVGVEFDEMMQKKGEKIWLTRA
ncbi:beta-lactamase/transpeptidase-like protein [Aspergillus pseudodeflectus]|uniref:Beta-lactamase/transpeptidase-like protein n=1 Tax=Aspergillus pseudodeflectus TaxID=176178 RepID=A0ABR4JJT9_9EURO